MSNPWAILTREASTAVLRECGYEKEEAMTERPSTIIISDWLANCQVGQWTPFEAATALKNVLAKEGYAIVRAAWDKGEHEGCGIDSQRAFVPLERTAVPVEVREKNGTIDEICIHSGNVHIEQMSNDGWFMGVDASDGSYWQFWFGAKNRKSHVEFRHTETISAAEQASATPSPKELAER